jgi:hypothetical protein
LAGSRHLQNFLNGLTNGGAAGFIRPSKLFCSAEAKTV